MLYRKSQYTQLTNNHFPFIICHHHHPLPYRFMYICEFIIYWLTDGILSILCRLLDVFVLVLITDEGYNSAYVYYIYLSAYYLSLPALYILYRFRISMYILRIYERRCWCWYVVGILWNVKSRKKKIPSNQYFLGLE